ncbi:MAG TPA: hypothetical protein VFL12_02635 [Thermoanaerobaculia bacterium]|nr:hypothetical protein [Thermoanaerobaculia bacterium]
MNPCRRISEVIAGGGALGPDAEQHLFVCPRCRRRARSGRVDREIAAFGRPPASDAPVPPDFVARVMRGLPPRRALAAVPVVWKWAAALAVFSAAAGYGYTVWTETLSAGQQVTATGSAPQEETAYLSF